MFNLELYQIINIIGLILGVAYGMVAQSQQFCFGGSIKDYILTKSTKRASSVVMAMIVAVAGTTIVSSTFDIDLSSTVYYMRDINYFSIILGGILFGSGMVLADGCSNRHLIKFGQGDSKSLVTLVFIAIFAYATTKGFLYGYFGPIIKNPILIEWSSKIENFSMNVYMLIGILVVILLFLTKGIKRILLLWDGFLIGLIVVAAWYVTGAIGSDSIERLVNTTGITFVYPTAKSLELFVYYEVNNLSFPISLVIGVVLGTFMMSFINKKYSFGCTSTQKIDRIKFNMLGGALMGVGGMLSLGCTIGQGLTGLSTLAFASVIAISSIMISGLITALILNKYGKLPMCFIFEWKDKKTPEYYI